MVKNDHAASLVNYMFQQRYDLVAGGFETVLYSKAWSFNVSVGV